MFRNGYQSHAATETCPGHSTILTGDHPARTGIIGNIWIDQSIARADKAVYCAEDERVPGSSSTHYKVSPKHLLVPTLGDLMKARWPGSRNVAVSGKDRAAVMMSGHNADQRWYWDGKQFTTDLAGAPVPQVVGKVNAAIAAALAQPRPPLDPPPSASRKRARFRSKAAVSRSDRAGSPARPGMPPRCAPRPRWTATRWRSPPLWSTRCSSGVARPPTCSRSASRRPIMSATPTAPRARKCAFS